jgi:predicted branched-subunit amino acid permease
VPLVFLALMIPALKNRSMYVAAAVAGLLTLALLWLPYMLGVFAAALVAIFAGYLHLERTSHDA